VLSATVKARIALVESGADERAAMGEGDDPPAGHFRQDAMPFRALRSAG